VAGFAKIKVRTSFPYPSRPVARGAPAKRRLMSGTRRTPSLTSTLLLVAAAVTAGLLFALPSHARELQGLVIGVADGDTLTLLVHHERVRIRLAEIDAPERGQPYGTRARQSLAELCHERIATVVEAGKDRYGRTVGMVSCGGIVVNREQVRRGLAWVYSRYTRRDSPLYAVQREARTQARGLWQADHPQPPWEWRNRRRASYARAHA
jgi:endonuclease YncB( thermonuclease family)